MTDADRARGDALRRARELRGLSQNYVSRTAKIDVKTIQRLEAGTASPNLTTLVALADLYGQSLDALAGRSALVEGATPPATGAAETESRSGAEDLDLSAMDRDLRALAREVGKQGKEIARLRKLVEHDGPRVRRRAG